MVIEYLTGVLVLGLAAVSVAAQSLGILGLVGATRISQLTHPFTTFTHRHGRV